MSTNAIVDRLVDEVISVCEPEAGDDVATAHTRKVLTQKFTPLVDSLSRNLAAARTKEMQARGAYKLMENDLAAARQLIQDLRETIEQQARLLSARDQQIKLQAEKMAFLKRELEACEGSLRNSGNMVRDLNDLAKQYENDLTAARRDTEIVRQELNMQRADLFTARRDKEEMRVRTIKEIAQFIKNEPIHSWVPGILAERILALSTTSLITRRKSHDHRRTAA